LPPPTTAALDALTAITGDAFDVEDGERHCDNCTDHGGAGRPESSERRLEKASGYFYFWSEDSADWTVAPNNDFRDLKEAICDCRVHEAGRAAGR